MGEIVRLLGNAVGGLRRPAKMPTGYALPLRSFVSRGCSIWSCQVGLAWSGNSFCDFMPWILAVVGKSLELLYWMDRLVTLRTLSCLYRVLSKAESQFSEANSTDCSQSYKMPPSTRYGGKWECVQDPPTTPPLKSWLKQKSNA